MAAIDNKCILNEFSVTLESQDTFKDVIMK